MDINSLTFLVIILLLILIVIACIFYSLNFSHNILAAIISSIITIASCNLYKYFGAGNLIKSYYSNQAVIDNNKLKHLRGLLAKMQRAMISYQYRIAIDNKDTIAWFSLGKLYQIQRDFEKAAVHFKVAHDLEPNNIDIFEHYINAQTQVEELKKKK